MMRRLGGVVGIAGLVLGLSACLPGGGGTGCEADANEPNDLAALATPVAAPTIGNDVNVEGSLDPCLGHGDRDYFVVDPPASGDSLAVWCTTVLPDEANLYRVNRFGERLEGGVYCPYGAGIITTIDSGQPLFYEVSWTEPTEVDYTLRFEHQG